VRQSTRDLLVMIAVGASVVPISLGLACVTRTVERPVPVVPPPCLAELAPTPPAADALDSTWSAYHVRLEAWAASVERSCGSHLLPANP
jgi:hypothetical protein